MTSALAPFTRIAPSASVSGDGLVTHALNLRAIRAAKAGFIIVRNSGKSPNYSRIDRARNPFTPASVNLGAASRRTSLEPWPDALARIRSFSGGIGGALAARRFNSSPINTHRTSSPNDLNAVSMS